MNQEAIFILFFGLMILTISVWLYMYSLRLPYLMRNKINPQDVSTTGKLLKVIPEKINLPAENLRNLFELPILFYASCIYLYITNSVDAIYLFLAYSFLLLRVIHSVIHCTYNKVMHRFYFYLGASISLWLIIILAFVDIATTTVVP